MVFALPLKIEVHTADWVFVANKKIIDSLISFSFGVIYCRLFDLPVEHMVLPMTATFVYFSYCYTLKVQKHILNYLCEVKGSSTKNDLCMMS